MIGEQFMKPTCINNNVKTNYEVVDFLNPQIIYIPIDNK